MGFTQWAQYASELPTTKGYARKVDMPLDPSKRCEWNTPQDRKSRLVMPEVESGESTAAIGLSAANGDGGKVGGDGTTDPLIQGLVDRLPNPDSTWSLDDRAKWLRTAASIFGLVYKASDGEHQEISVVFAEVETADSH
jgi:hypothetical protein